MWAFFAYLDITAYLSSKNSISLLAVIVTALLSVLFFVREPARENSSHLLHNAIALISVYLQPFLRPSTFSIAPMVGDFLILTGLSIQILSLIFLNRSMGFIAALREIKSNGPYRLIRHPLYTGYLTMIFGLTILNTSWWNVCIAAVITCLILIRIPEEEAFLERDPVYRHYKEKTPHILIPFLY